MSKANRERNLRWVDLYEGGWSYAEIGREYERSRSSVHEVVQRLHPGAALSASRKYHRALRSAERELAALETRRSAILATIASIESLFANPVEIDCAFCGNTHKTMEEYEKCRDAGSKEREANDGE